MTDPSNSEFPPASAAEGTPGSHPSSFGVLLWTNVKVVLGLSVVAVFAYLVWLGLKALFPDIAWLQG